MSICDAKRNIYAATWENITKVGHKKNTGWELTDVCQTVLRQSSFSFANFDHTEI